MRHIFNTLDTTPDPSCAGKLADKAKYCGQLTKIVENTDPREAAIETAMANLDDSISERDKAIVANDKAKNAALKLNSSISPVSVTADALEKILNEGKGKNKDLKAWQNSFDPPILKSCLDALRTVVTRMNEVATRRTAVADRRTELADAKAALAKTLENIDRLTKSINKLDKDMAGLNCGNGDGCNNDPPPSVNKKKNKKRRTT